LKIQNIDRTQLLWTKSYTIKHMNYFIHPNGICESKKIGKNTRIWAFAHILPNAQIGDNCNICDQTFIENDVTIGNNVTIKCGVQLWDGTIIEDDVFIGPNVTFTNDKFPRSKKYPEKFLVTKVERGASVGANSTILPGITIGQNAMIGAGSVVTHSVPANAIVIGNPARISGYANSNKTVKQDQKSSQDRTKLTIKGAKLYDFPKHQDLRGSLIASEFRKDMPFKPKRYFIVYDVPTKDVRGEHAHKICDQLLICLRGSISIVLDNGKIREEIKLDSPSIGILIPHMVWATQYKYSDDAILLCFASHEYDPNDYIRDYSEYQSLI